MLAISLPPKPAPAVLAAALAFAVTTAAMVLLFLPSWQSMASIWWNNETYTHGMLVPLVTAWLIWRERAAVAGMTPKPTRLTLPVLLPCGAAWLVAYLAGINSVQHFAVVAMLPCLFVLFFGWRIAWKLAFPLAFLFFAVPFGEFLMPWLMDRTADFTVLALQVSGVPVLRDGRNFVLPSGRWSVVEACSGLRYLLAAIPLAMLYAYLSFRSMRTRALYVGIVVLVALVANWMRAYLIVMLGHLSSMKLAAGVDHLIYGWLFFGIVLGGAFWFGSLLPDLPVTGRSRSRRRRRTADAEALPLPSSARMALLSGFGILVMAATAFAGAALQRQGGEHIQLSAFRGELVADLAAVSGYRPTYEGARGSAVGMVAGGAPVGVGVYHYFHQQRTGEMITHGNGVASNKEGGSRIMVRRQSGASPIALPGTEEGGDVAEYELERDGQRWLAWEWFWVNGRVYADPRRVKLATAVALLSGLGDESLAFVMWTPMTDSPDKARERLAAEAVRLLPAARRAGL
ncbi:MAG: exosortase A [Burkholderiales bacterium]|nr:exosortase A [Burkholderiales bacterium]